jgi:hypothetical protein
VPNCYYVTSSSPGQAVRDLRDCVSEVGGPGDIDRRPPMTDGAMVHAWVYYVQLSDAMRYLNPIKKCMEDKGHRVYKAKILHDFEEVGLSESD